MESQPAQTPDQNSLATQGEALRTSDPQKTVVVKNRRFHFPRFLILLIALFLLLGLMEGGYFYYKNSVNKHTAETPLSSPTPTAQATTPDPTAEWKIYEGEVFSFKYPDDWTLTKTEVSTVIYPPGVNPKELIGSTTKTLFIEAYAKEVNPEECKGPCPIIENVTSENINGIDAKRLEGNVPGTIGGNTPHKYITYVIYNDGVYYVLSLSGVDLNEIPQEYQTIFDQILFTFKFKDSDSVTPTIPQKKAGYAQSGCKITGCSNQLCVDSSSENVISTCEYNDSYTCYKTAVCEKHDNGKCGWTQTEELTTCINNTE
jgi:hypothetical protein